jgi:ferric hydroxamate transport system substrate-binding protein
MGMSRPRGDRRALLAGLAAGVLGLVPGGFAASPAGASDDPRRAETGGAPAARVVALDGLFAETLLAIGLVPVAIANRPLYEKLIAQPPLPDSVLDLGPLQEPNLEFLSLIAPDLILAAPWQAQIQVALTRIAPVVALPIVAGAREPIDHLDALTRDLGDRVDRAAAARALVAGTDGALAEARAALAGRTGRPVYICRFRDDGRQLAVFGTRSTVGAVAQRLGLTNAWTGRQSGAGTVLAAVEDLAEVPDATLIHFDRGAETARALGRLDDSPLWRALPAVRAGRVIRMPVVHPNGGLPSAARFARQVAAALGKAPA